MQAGPTVRLASVVRRPTLLRALVAVVGLALVAVASAVGTAAPASATAPAPGTPLLVSIDSLTPGEIPEQGPIQIRGSVTNRDDEAWSDVDLYPFISSTPIQSRAALAEAAALPADEYVGDRILEVEDSVDVLQPGSSSTFTISVPRSLINAYIGGAPGVYWFGVHAIGASASLARDTFADGRARTFLPLVPPQTKGAVRTAMVVPMRRFLGREPDGSLSDPESWQRSLSPDGRLREAVEFGAAAGPGSSAGWSTRRCRTPYAGSPTATRRALSLRPTRSPSPASPRRRHRPRTGRATSRNRSPRSSPRRWRTHRPG